MNMTLNFWVPWTNELLIAALISYGDKLIVAANITLMLAWKGRQNARQFCFYRNLNLIYKLSTPYKRDFCLRGTPYMGTSWNRPNPAIILLPIWLSTHKQLEDVALHAGLLIPVPTWSIPWFFYFSASSLTSFYTNYRDVSFFLWTPYKKHEYNWRFPWFMVKKYWGHPVWWPGLKNSPTVAHACRKRRLRWDKVPYV